ncbi:hypothetical protein SDRG_12917 [Saprolegnia diclina VS20]|uniref:Uncharacterized protein n=1 Tax=Saprolegnia diclina (strain VS20) TaxID=1156394 RepID=T0Q7N4_SAPDV|nr:hypothetical protein SDRG_12917 [Saprolegnia diclina VS20]EQC29455.1 hypothetical protein SDRG_12917 [Saprolegnia diclina VS20]|eukprot:XP_008617222.1 hypothetical protein SDRG_12917 [Saprolegnia diclina VS20]
MGLHFPTCFVPTFRWCASTGARSNSPAKRAIPDGRSEKGRSEKGQLTPNGNEKTKSDIAMSTSPTSTSTPTASTTSSPPTASSPVFSVMDGAITRQGLEAAARVYLSQDEDAPELLIARNVPLVHWLTHGLDNRLFNVIWSCRFHGDAADPATLASVYIVRATGKPNQAGVQNLNNLLTPQQGNHLIVYTGFDLKLLGQTRLPDLAVFQKFRDSQNIRLCMVVEVELKNRSFPRMLRWLRGYFRLIPSLRTAVGIKIFGPQRGNARQFGTIAVMLHRAVGHTAQLAYVASIGTAPLTDQAMATVVGVIGQDAANAMPHFDVNIAHEIALGHEEWQLDAIGRPVLHITIADLLYLDNANLLAGAPPTTERLEIDLYKLIFKVHEAMGQVVITDDVQLAGESANEDQGAEDKRMVSMKTRVQF